MTSIDNINIIVAEKTNKSKDLVKKINSLYWKKISNNLTNLSDTTTSLKGLFNFTISKYLISEKIGELILSIRRLKKSSKFREKTKGLILDRYYTYLRKLLIQRNEIAKLYYERHTRISKSNSESFEKRRQARGGNSEQSQDESQRSE